MLPRETAGTYPQAYCGPKMTSSRQKHGPLVRKHSSARPPTTRRDRRQQPQRQMSLSIFGLHDIAMEPHVSVPIRRAAKPELAPLQRPIDFIRRYPANSISDGFELRQSGTLNAANWHQQSTSDWRICSSAPATAEDSLAH